MEIWISFTNQEEVREIGVNRNDVLELGNFLFLKTLVKVD